jgi:hypothetical protein
MAHRLKSSGRSRVDKSTWKGVLFALAIIIGTIVLVPPIIWFGGWYFKL